jgi:hypothetical protein
VTSTAILDSTIAAADLGTDAVTTAKILDGNVTGAKIADGTVDTVDLAAGAVTTGRLATKAVDSGQLADGAVTTLQLAPASVTRSKLETGVIDAGALATAAVETAELAADAVTSAKIKNGEIVAEDIADGTVTGAKVADASLRMADLAAPNGSNAPLVGSINVDPADLAGDSCAVESASVAGIVPGDRPILHVDANLEAGLIAEPLIADTANTLRLRVCNTKASSVDGSSRPYGFIILR